MALPALLDWLGTAHYHSRAWCRHNGLKVYVRCTRRNFDGVAHDCVDIGNLEITDARRRGKGRFKSTLRDLAKALPQQSYLYVENVLTPQFVAYFERTCWHRATAGFIDATATPCFYKRVDEFTMRDFE